MNAHDRARRANLYEPMSWALLRAPLLPAMTEVTGDEPHVRAALAVASGDLVAALARPSGSPRRQARVQDRLLRYLIRMRSRPTPFGLFAGVAVVQWGDQSDLAVSGRAPRTRTRPDMEWLLGLVDALEQDEEIRPELLLRADQTLVVHGGRVFRHDHVGDEVSVRATAAVLKILELARTNASQQTLRGALTHQQGATPEKAEALVDRLWREGYLFSELRPPLTGGDPSAYVLERLRKMPAARQVADGLEEALDLLEAWDALDLGARADALPRAQQRLHQVHPAPAGGTTVQTDLAWNLDGYRLSRTVGRQAAQAAELLLRLHPNPDGAAHRETYRRAFVDRYGSEREVPLLEMLDPQIGLGPPPAPSPKPPTQRDRLLAQVALDAARDGNLVVDLDDSLLAELSTWVPDANTAPRSLDLTVLLVASTLEAIDRGDYTLVTGPQAGTDAAGRVLSRFADLLGESGRTALTSAVAADQALAPGCLYVEVVHAPTRARAANVAVHLAVCEQEVLIGLPPGVPEHQVVPVDELTVSASGQRLVVRWPAADAEVVATQTHMLNRRLAPPAARLLMDLANDGRCGFTGFDWGSIASKYPALPRVQRGRVVLSPASWRCRTTGDEDLGTWFRDWRTRWGVPRHVYLTAGDNRLLLDLDNFEHHRVVEGELRSAGGVQLQEALPGQESAWLPGRDGCRMADLVVPLVLRSGLTTAEPSVRRPAAHGDPRRLVAPSERLRLPGSDWLYLKLYGPTTFQDDLISNHLPDLARSITQAGLSDGWFFIRYADPHPHLRVRLHGTPANLWGPALREICAWAGRLVAEGLCSRFALDTYEREVERYGGAVKTLQAERIFCADSAAVATILGLVRDARLPFDLTTVATLTVDDLLDGFGLDPGQRMQLYCTAAPLTPEGGDQYRLRKAELREVLSNASPAQAEILTPVLRTRRVANDDVVAVHIARSHVHMHLNRLLNDPTAEQTVLELLRRTHTGLERSIRSGGGGS